ncbi:tigger transposable element-derived protein 1-like [Palaemon carinicauda]|uniref:tigger transposable element-derived protein 1-like n=1 Tax=Palaemon carinicauda TaxID=392227 RepID=UPI0035B586F7
MPGHKPMKDRLTLLLCANANGDCKIKPLLVYHLDNPRVFERNNILEKCTFSYVGAQTLNPGSQDNSLPMDQQVISNFKKLYTKALFRKYFEVNSDTQLTLKEFWKDHISILNCVNMIDQAWCGVTYRTLNSAWQKLWPSCVTEREFEGFQSEAGSSTASVISEDTVVIEEIVGMGRSMGLEVNKEDIDELVDSHSTELTVKELLHLQQQQQ